MIANRNLGKALVRAGPPVPKREGVQGSGSAKITHQNEPEPELALKQPNRVQQRRKRPQLSCVCVLPHQDCCSNDIIRNAETFGFIRS